MSIISVRNAIKDALAEEMRRDDKVFLQGESIGKYGGCFKVTEGLIDEFGPRRVKDTPLSESVIVGSGIGAALYGYRPVVEIMFADFMALAMDQMVNNAAKMRYMHDGKQDLPIVIRAPQGAGMTMGPHHSQSVEAWLMNIPGLKIVLPSNAYDAKGLLKSAIRDNDPVIFLENKLLYNEKGEVPDGEDYTVPIGKAKVVREGKDLTIISYSHMMKKVLKVAETMQKQGIEIEVVDLRTLRPLDVETITESVKKTGRALIVHEATVFGGAGAEIATTIQKEAFDYLDAPIERVGAVESPVPFSPVLEDAYLPNEEKIIKAVNNMLNL